ncbi:hypothetical protein [Streptomyces sp. CB02923]|uniref:hypothetical protein n=1 Tax=Streptomyces sp. CB02923 TaxID=1718985 RepID=UPI0018FF8B7D|nr:hypothetical protein [Streptomyces sp. CB02923]
MNISFDERRNTAAERGDGDGTNDGTSDGTGDGTNDETGDHRDTPHHRDTHGQRA